VEEEPFLLGEREEVCRHRLEEEVEGLSHQKQWQFEPLHK